MPERRRPHSIFRRRGVATLWLVIWLPVLLVLFCVIVGVAHLWLARVELETGLEAAALAAAKHWGGQGGGDTQEARQIGVAYAAANNLRGNEVTISENYDPAATPCGAINPNQNLSYELMQDEPRANLIFGAIEVINGEVVLNPNVCPGGGPGTVLFDATGNGGGALGAENAWGISFQKASGPVPANLKIDAVEINLRGAGGSANGSFAASLVISENTASQPAVHDNSGNEQDDTAGFNVAEINDPADTQIEWSLAGPGNSVLRFDFRPDPTNPGGDQGFEPGDRFRFGIDVSGVSKGDAADDGDGIGRDVATATVYFSIAGAPQPPVTAEFIDNTDRMNDCLDPAEMNSTTGTLVVHPSLIPDLPCPATSAPNNNGQSYVLIRGGEAGRFGVLAQAIAPVQKFNFPLLGDVDRYAVQAKAVAEYDVLTGRVRLIHIDRLLTP
jgi:hypothetical protein